MKQDGYSEEYRRGVLKAALDRYDGKLAADESGERPLNRPPGYQREVWRKAKKEELGKGDGGRTVRLRDHPATIHFVLYIFSS